MLRSDGYGRSDGPESPGPDRWEFLVRRIMEAAAPELARLRRRRTVVGQVDEWTRTLLPLAAVLILVFGSILAWSAGRVEGESGEYPLMAEALVPEAVGLWLEAGAHLTLEEFMKALENGGP